MKITCSSGLTWNCVRDTDTLATNWQPESQMCAKVKSKSMSIEASETTMILIVHMGTVSTFFTTIHFVFLFLIKVSLEEASSGISIRPFGLWILSSRWNLLQMGLNHHSEQCRVFRCAIMRSNLFRDSLLLP